MSAARTAPAGLPASCFKPVQALLDLPDDCLGAVLGLLELPAVGALRRTCRLLRDCDSFAWVAARSAHELAAALQRAPTGLRQWVLAGADGRHIRVDNTATPAVWHAEIRALLARAPRNPRRADAMPAGCYWYPEETLTECARRDSAEGLEFLFARGIVPVSPQRLVAACLTAQSARALAVLEQRREQFGLSEWFCPTPSWASEACLALLEKRSIDSRTLCEAFMRANTPLLKYAGATPGNIQARLESFILYDHEQCMFEALNNALIVGGEFFADWFLPFAEATVEPKARQTKFARFFPGGHTARTRLLNNCEVALVTRPEVVRWVVSWPGSLTCNALFAACALEESPAGEALFEEICARFRTEKNHLPGFRLLLEKCARARTRTIIRRASRLFGTIPFLVKCENDGYLCDQKGYQFSETIYAETRAHSGLSHVFENECSLLTSNASPRTSALILAASAEARAFVASPAVLTPLLAQLIPTNLQIKPEFYDNVSLLFALVTVMPAEVARVINLSLQPRFSKFVSDVLNTYRGYYILIEACAFVLTMPAVPRLSELIAEITESDMILFPELFELAMSGPHATAVVEALLTSAGAGHNTQTPQTLLLHTERYDKLFARASKEPAAAAVVAKYPALAAQFVYRGLDVAGAVTRFLPSATVTAVCDTLRQTHHKLVWGARALESLHAHGASLTGFLETADAAGLAYAAGLGYRVPPGALRLAYKHALESSQRPEMLALIAFILSTGAVSPDISASLIAACPALKHATVLPPDAHGW